MQKRRTKINYNLLSPVEIFKLVLAGEIKKFPNGFWSNPNGEENAVEILRYLFESILQWTSEDIKKYYNQQLFIEYKLYGMLAHAFTRLCHAYRRQTDQHAY